MKREAVLTTRLWPVWTRQDRNKEDLQLAPAKDRQEASKDEKTGREENQVKRRPAHGALRTRLPESCYSTERHQQDSLSCWISPLIRPLKTSLLLAHVLQAGPCCLMTKQN